jgi:hypothetical protein
MFFNPFIIDPHFNPTKYKTLRQKKPYEKLEKGKIYEINILMD